MLPSGQRMKSKLLNLAFKGFWNQVPVLTPSSSFCVAGSLKGNNVSSITGSEGMDFGLFEHDSEWKTFIEDSKTEE